MPARQELCLSACPNLSGGREAANLVGVLA
jgi:hypothetical protein